MTLKIIDSHTGGEPTRTLVAGMPDLGTGTMAERLSIMRDQHDHIRRALVTEPRGSDVMVGAVLQPAREPDNAAGVIFFNNVGYLGMCGHGTIGLAVTLYHMGRLPLGEHRLETPVGPVSFTLHSASRVSINNVPSYRFAKDVPVTLTSGETIHGDIAWGGNWFFLIKDHGLALSRGASNQLIDYCWQVRELLAAQGITGADGAEIDHIELFADTDPEIADSRNFVLCPGREYDRSPCGTGTSAKLACLYADGLLVPGQIWRQQSIIGSCFEGTVSLQGEKLVPRITGEAFVNLEASVVLNQDDPFVCGLG